MEELQWAHILVKTNGEDLPNVLEIWIAQVCYSLILWWEIRPSLRKASFDNRGKTNNLRDEVGGDVNARVGPCKRKRRVMRGSRFCSGQLKGREGRRAGRGVKWTKDGAKMGRWPGPLKDLSW